MHNTFTQAIRIHRFGGPEVLEWEEIPLSPPAPEAAQLAERPLARLAVRHQHREPAAARRAHRPRDVSRGRARHHQLERSVGPSLHF